MSAIEESDDAVRRAGRIASRSRIAMVADFIVDRSVATVRSSRALTLARLGLREFQSLPPRERTLRVDRAWRRAGRAHRPGVDAAGPGEADARPDNRRTARRLAAHGEINQVMHS